MWQLYDLTTESNVTTAAWRSMDDVVGDIMVARIGIDAI